MKHVFLALLMCLSMVSCCIADTIYLKDGSIVRNCRVVGRKKETVVVEKGEKWEKYDLANIETIDYDNKERVSVANNIEQNMSASNDSVGCQKDGYAVKIGLDMAGNHTLKNTALHVSGYSTQRGDNVTTQTENGFVVTGEYLKFLDSNFCLGAGVAYQFPRKQVDYAGYFQFIPVYALVSYWSATDDWGRRKYLVGQVGFSSFYGDKAYVGSGGKLSGGLHYGVGAGIVGKRFVAELLYSIDNGSYGYSGLVYDSAYSDYRSFTISTDIEYSKLTLNVGIRL